jgi:methyltransferase
MSFAISTWPYWALAVFAYVIIQRLAELVYANANTRRLLAEGGREFGRRHYPLFILLHGGWLIAIAWTATPAETPNLLLLAGFIASQLFRFWTLASIGRWWTTRIISAPHFPRVKKGPYRFIPHPNYTVVVAEIALLPLLLDAPFVAIAFSVANALLLSWRIWVEAAVLEERRTH